MTLKAPANLFLLLEGLIVTITFDLSFKVSNKGSIIQTKMLRNSRFVTFIYFSKLKWFTHWLGHFFSFWFPLSQFFPLNLTVQSLLDWLKQAAQTSASPLTLDDLYVYLYPNKYKDCVCVRDQVCITFINYINTWMKVYLFISV